MRQALSPFASPTIASTRLGPVEWSDIGGGAPVLALHGAMGGHDQSEILMRTIAPGWGRVVAMSRPGYLGTALALGRSEGEQADLCAALLDSLGIKRTIVAAVSGGGLCAQHFALRYPDRCRALILVSTCSGPNDPALPWMFRLLPVLAAIPPVAAAMRRASLADPAAAATRAVRDPQVRARLLADDEASSLFFALTGSTSDRMKQRLPGTFNDINIFRNASVPPLDRITCPALVIHGTEDAVAGYHHGERLAHGIPGAELVPIAGGEHVAIFTHMTEVRDRVARFLASLS